MKINLLATGLAGAVAIATLAPHLSAEPPKPAAHRVVFELTSEDAQVWDGVLNNVENVQKALGPTSVEVVAHGKGLAMLTTAKNGVVRERLQRNASGGVTFAACENSMKKSSTKKRISCPLRRPSTRASLRSSANKKPGGRTSARDREKW